MPLTSLLIPTRYLACLHGPRVSWSFLGHTSVFSLCLGNLGHEESLGGILVLLSLGIVENFFVRTHWQLFFWAPTACQA